MKPTYLSQVADFHRAFRYKQPEPIAPAFDDKATNELRPRLISEEIHELKDAYHADSRVDMLDALCDAQYVLSGAVLAWGLRSLWENHRHMVNLRKIRDLDQHIAAMLGLNGQLEIAAKLGYAHSAYTFLMMLQERLTQAVYSLGFTEKFGEAFAAVHANNLAKIWTKDEATEWQESARSESWVELFFEPTEGGYIARRSDHKIIKPLRHTKVDLGRFV